MRGVKIKSLAFHGRAERRGKPRIHIPFPAVVRGVDVDGQKFESNAVVENMSAGGVYLRFWRRVPPGARLFIATRLSAPQATAPQGLRVAFHGHVLRSERSTSGEYAAAMRIERYRFL